MQQIDIALQYALHGIRIFPCVAGTKRPILKGAFHSATTDADVIKDWWLKYPTALIAAPNHQFAVLDVDDYGLSPPVNHLMGVVRKRLARSPMIQEHPFVVTSPRGGRHYYFAPLPEGRRRIGMIAKVDFLSQGGYVMLPGQGGYFCSSEEPWKDITHLPELDTEELSQIVDDCADFSKAIKTLIDAEKKEKNSAPKKQAAEVESVDKETGEITLTTEHPLYRRSGNEYIPADPYHVYPQSMQFEEGALSSEVMMRFFHNQGIQKRMAEYLGVQVPKENESTTMHSLLPDHDDEKKSLGVRWSKDRSHLVLRDFANFYSEGGSIDYNLTRFYACIARKAHVNRLGATEFMVWTTRLMVDSGVLDVSNLVRSTHPGIENEKPGLIRVFHFVQLLDATKRLSEGYTGSTVISLNFGAAWMGLTPKTVGLNLKKLVDKGYLAVMGEHDCSGGKRADGFFNSKLYRIVEHVNTPTDRKRSPDAPVRSRKHHSITHQRREAARGGEAVSECRHAGHAEHRLDVS